MVKITIDSHLRIPLPLPEKLHKAILRETTYKDPLVAIKRAQGIPVWGMPRKMVTHEVADTEIKLWRGSLRTVVALLKEYGSNYKLVDNRLWLPKVDALTSTIVLRDYQEKPAEVAIKRQQTIVRGPAGSGKTELLLYCAAHFQRPTLVLVNMERHQNTWLERVPKYFRIEPGGIGGAFKKQRLAPITIGLVQSVRNRIDVLAKVFSTIICDEVNRFAAPTLSETVNAFPAAVRLGASDDERRRDGREFLLYDTFGPKGYDLGKTTGQAEVEIVAIPTQFKTDAYDWTGYINEVVADEDRNMLILSIATAEAEAGHRVLIWSDRVAHCRFLKNELQRRGISAGLILGGKKNKGEANATENGLRSGSVQVGIGSSVAEASINIPDLDRGIVTCSSADSKLLRFKQLRGRLARKKDGKKSVMYFLWDRHVVFAKSKVNNIRRRYRVIIMKGMKEEWKKQL